MLEKYSSFINEEFTKEDRNFIREMSDHFTLSVEYELMANYDIEDEPYVETEEDIERSFNFVKDQVFLDMSRGRVGYRFDESYRLTVKKLRENEELMFAENDVSKLNKKNLMKLHQKYVTLTWVTYFIDFLLSKVDVDDEEVTDSRLNKAWETDKDDYIATLVLKHLQSLVFERNLGFMIDKFKEYMPKFYQKYNDDFKYEAEGAMNQRILEFSSKTYIKGINACFDQIDDFYEEFDKQDFWSMSNEFTGLHVNVGINGKNVQWNPLKGLVIMSDMDRDKKTPFVFTDIMWRINNRFTQSLMDGIKRNLTGEIKKDYLTRQKERLWGLKFRHRERLATHKAYLRQNIEKLDVHNIKECEDFLNAYLLRANKDFYIKEFGIKLVELEYDPGYVEFRYVGGKVDKELLKDKILYFCYIVYLMTNEEYKKKQYQKRLYKYVEQIKDLVIQDEQHS